MRSPVTRAALLGATLVVAALPLAAQQEEHTHRPGDTTAAGGMARQRMMDMMMACPMMSSMMRGPAAALRARDALHLSASQVTRLEQVQRQVHQTHMRAMDSMRVLHPRLAALASAPHFDEQAVRAAFDRMGRLHTDMAVAMLRAQHETAGILTPGQRDSLAAMAHARGEKEGLPTSGGREAGPAACGMMEQPSGPSGPGVKQDSVHNHRHGADTTGARP